MGKRDRGSDVSRKDKKKRSKSRDKKVKEEQIVKGEDGESADLQTIKINSTDIVKQSPDPVMSNVLADEDRPVFFHKRAKLSISLLPWSLKDCKQSVENSLRKMVLKYSNGLGGILMAYDGVKLEDREKTGGSSQGQGWILNELPHVHYDVSCNVLVFFPSVGCQVRAVKSWH